MPALVYSQLNQEPPLAVAPPHNVWRRVAPPQRLAAALKPYEPMVVRFDWIPPATLANDNVALLALCTAAADPLPNVPPPAIASISDLVTQERRAALRIVEVGPLAPRHVYIRDGVDDSGRRGETAFVGRSPDIMVMPQNLVPGNPAAALKDLLDQRPQDRIHGSVDNAVIVRVHNRGPVAVSTEVHVWVVKLGADNVPTAVPDTWTRLTPEPAAAVNTVLVPPRDVAYATIPWPGPVADPNPGDDEYKAYALLAFIRSVDAAVPALSDPLPEIARIVEANRADAIARFQELFGSSFDSDNSALRVVRYEPQ
jgi:hypothetical protein